MAPRRLLTWLARPPRPTAQFLEMLQYNVSISASLYASYYFELRTLCEKAERTFSLKPLTEEQQLLIFSGERNHPNWRRLQFVLPIQLYLLRAAAMCAFVSLLESQQPGGQLRMRSSWRGLGGTETCS